ncbi:helicase-like protein [Trifolium medium]|uniref:Helicase-like protein n=1 Tax=Trifolium medium TaxID=97028 RepID=A0A392MR91_9FABA|nr:helicase-like protein [Trifolium medium]
MARSRLMEQDITHVKLKLISERKSDGRIYNKPTVSEVAALIVGDVDSAERRDIILETQSGQLQRIDEFHPNYLSYQYPLIFPYGEDGYRTDVTHRIRPSKKGTIRTKLTIREWLAFRLQSRQLEAKTLLASRRLFQQFLVDAYTMMEADRLTWLRNNQSTLRVGKYNNLNDSRGDTSTSTTKKGKRVVLPSSFVGGKRYMDGLYFDGMAISAAVGFPDLFITFTCNPNWPEIQRCLKKDNLKPHERPDIVTRVFKIKFDQLLQDLTKKHVLGKVVACKY